MALQKYNWYGGRAALSGRYSVSGSLSGWVVFSEDGKVFFQSAKSEDGIEREGFFNKEGNLHGSARRNYPNGDFVRGRFDNGVLVDGVGRNTVGTYTTLKVGDQLIENGSFPLEGGVGSIHGRLVNRRPDGYAVKIVGKLTQDGMWKQGNFVRGLLVDADGTKFDGRFVDGKANGRVWKNDRRTRYQNGSELPAAAPSQPELKSEFRNTYACPPVRFPCAVRNVRIRSLSYVLPERRWKSKWVRSVSRFW
jgi:hypothetical protein